MKKIFLYLLIGTGILTSCNENDPNDDHFNVDSESGWVQFENSSNLSVISGSITQVVIPVSLESPVNGSGLRVSYTITDIVGASSSVIASNPGVFSISEDELTGNLVLGLNPTPLTSAVSFDIELTATSRSNVALGLSDNSRPIKKRVCISPIFASYTGVSTPVIGGQALNPAPEFVTTITPIAGEANTYAIASAWGPNYVAFLVGDESLNGEFPFDATLFIDPLTGEIEITGSDPDLYGSVAGESFVDSCTGIIHLSLLDGLFSDGINTQVELTPN